MADGNYAAKLGWGEPQPQGWASSLGTALNSSLPAWMNPGGYAARLLTPVAQSMVQGAINAAALPGDVYAGRVDPNSDVGIGRAADLAGMVTLGAGVVPGGANEARMGIKAYHGSPHDFNQFSTEKIGTGEGAQAYGHGLYFAESEGVAKSYRDALGPKRGVGYSQRDRMRVDVGGKRQELTSEPQVRAWRSLHEAGGWGGVPDAFENAKKFRADDPQALVWLDKWEKQGAKTVEDAGGKTYEVSIDAHPDEFLNWDAMISEQPKKVQEALAGLGYNKDELGTTLRNTLSGSGGARAAEALKVAGIKGIRYKDAGSRLFGDAEKIVANYGSREKALEVAQQRLSVASHHTDRTYWQKIVDELGKSDTSNYVVFDDKTISILKKYGIAGLIAAGGGSALAQGLAQKAGVPGEVY